MLGVSLTGILDNPLLTLENEDLDLLLQDLRDVAVETNKEWAERLGIPQAQQLLASSLAVQYLS